MSKTNPTKETHMSTPNPLTRRAYEIYTRTNDADRTITVVACVTASKWGEAVRTYADTFHPGVEYATRHDRFLKQITIGGSRYFARVKEQAA